MRHLPAGACAGCTLKQSRAVLLCVLLLIWLYYSKQYKFDETKNKDFWLLLLMGSGTLYVILEYAEISLETKIVLLLIALVIISASCIKKSQLRIFKGIIPILVVGIVVVSLYGDVYDFSDGRIQFKGSHDFLIESCGQDIYDLAIEFKKRPGMKMNFWLILMMLKELVGFKSYRTGIVMSCGRLYLHQKR